MAQTIYNIVFYAMQIYYYLLFISVLVTWFPDIQRTFIGRTLYNLTEPYFGIFRRFIPAVRLGGGYMDFSPIVALLVWRLFVVSGVDWLLVKVLA
jgi:YggT family protein